MKQKLKTKSSAKKRFKITGTGKVKAAKKGRRHILTSKSQKLKRQSRNALILSAPDAKRVKEMLNN